MQRTFLHPTPALPVDARPDGARPLPSRGGQAIATITAATALALAAGAARAETPTGPFEGRRPVFSSDLGDTSIGSYGEVIYNNDLDGGRDQIEVRRLILFLGHEFTDWISLYTEIEVEHADEVEIEQAVVELRPRADLSISAGVLLIPLSYGNLFHEPTAFYSVERPELDRVLVPTTFREAGLGVQYRPTDWLTADVLVTGSLAAADRGGDLKTSNVELDGVRGLRQNASRATANDFAVSGRVAVSPRLGLTLAGGFFTGETDHDQSVTVDEQELDLPSARVTILETDARWEVQGFDLRGQLVYTLWDDAAELSRISGRTVGERQLGFHLEGAYDVLGLLDLDTDQRLHVFYRYSFVDLQDEVPGGFESNPASEWTVHTAGLAWFPVPEVVAKVDFEIRDDDADSLSDRLNAGIGYSF